MSIGSVKIWKETRLNFERVPDTNDTWQVFTGRWYLGELLRASDGNCYFTAAAASSTARMFPTWAEFIKTMEEER